MCNQKVLPWKVGHISYWFDWVEWSSVDSAPPGSSMKPTSVFRCADAAQHSPHVANQEQKQQTLKQTSLGGVGCVL